MRLSWGAAWNASGALALVTTLLLSGPGVTIVRAQETALASPAPPAPVCSVDAPADAELDARGRRVLRMRTKPAPAEPVVVLNTRGYGYGPAPEGDLESIRRELSRVQREAR